MDYDVVIIGAGPAGTHLSSLLAQEGVKVALVDRAVFPRDKLCGGLLSQKTIALLDAAYPDTYFPHFSVKQAHVTYKRQYLGAVPLMSSVEAICRYQFDNSLIKLAEARGVHTYLGEPIQKIDFEKQIVSTRKGRHLHYGHLVGADGALSIVRRLAGLPAAQLGFCAELYVQWEQIINQERLRENGIELFCGEFHKGYGWIFPNQTSVAIGVGCLTSEMAENEIIKAFPDFVRRYAKIETVKSRGAYVPSGSSVALGKPNCQTIALIGDAAGLIDPLTGEGIYYAVISAERAAEALLSDTNNFFSAYCDRMHDISKRIQEGVWVRNEFYNPLIMQNIFGASQGAPKYMETLINETIICYRKSYMTAYEEFWQCVR